MPPNLSRLHPSIDVLCLLPSDAAALTTEQLAAVCGGDVDGVLRAIASLAPSHTNQISTFEEAQLHAVKLA